MFNNFAKFELPAIKGNELWPETIQSPLIVRPSLTYVPNEHEPPRAEAFTKHFQDIVDAKSPQILNFLMTQRRNYQLGSVEFASTIRQADPLTMHYTNIQGKHEILGLSGTITPDKYQAMQEASRPGPRLIGRAMPGAPYIRRKSFSTSARGFPINGTAIRVVVININKVRDDNFRFLLNGVQVMEMNFAPNQEQTAYVVEAGNLKNAPKVEAQGPWEEIVVRGTKQYDTVKDSPFTLKSDEENTWRLENIGTNNSGNYLEVHAFLFDPDGKEVNKYVEFCSGEDGESFGGSFNLLKGQSTNGRTPSVIPYASGSMTDVIPGPPSMTWSVVDDTKVPSTEFSIETEPAPSGAFSVTFMPDK